MNSTEAIKHLKRWTLASFILDIKPKAEQGFHFYAEGDQRLTNQNPQFFELRIDGPYLKPLAKGEYKAYIEVSLLGNSTRNDKNRYQRQNLLSLLQSYLNKDFCCLRTGNENVDPVIDDGSLFGVYSLIPAEQIKASDFGMIDDAANVFQCTVEAHYEMFF